MKNDYISLRDFMEKFNIDDYPYQKLKLTMKFELINIWHNLHSDDFRNEWFILKQRLFCYIFGFNLIEIGKYLGDYILLFDNKIDAHIAFNIFEQKEYNSLIGIKKYFRLLPFASVFAYWYDKKEFETELKETPEYGDFISLWKRN